MSRRPAPSWVAALVVVSSAIGALRADFRPPRQLASDLPPRATPGENPGFAMGLDSFGLRHVAYATEDGVVLRTTGGDLDATVEVAEGASEPALDFFSVGFAISYRAGDDPGAIWLRERVGALFDTPRRVTPPHLDARVHVLSFGPDRRLAATWETRDAASTSIWYARDIPREPRTAILLGEGRFPRVEVDDRGRSHVLHLEHGGLRYYESPRGGLEIPRFPQIGDPAEGRITEMSTALHLGRTLFVTVVRGGVLYLARHLRENRFDVRRVATGVRRHHLKITGSGIIALAWERDGDIWYSIGSEFFRQDPTRVLITPERETDPRIDADSFANVHVVFVREIGPAGAPTGRELWATSDVGNAQAMFRAEPQRGEAPLEVAFHDESVGDVTAWSWDFGDGSTSAQPHPTHTFAATGEYIVRLTVSGTDGPSPLTHEERVLVISPGNEMWIGDTRAFPGQRDVHVPVLLTSDEPAQGFQIAATFDARVIEVHSLDFAATNIGILDAELQVFEVSHDLDDPFVTAGTLLDIEPPFNLRTIPPGRGQRIANLVVDVRRTARGGTETSIALRNETGTPPINNILVVRASTVLPALGSAGRIIIDEVTFPPPRFFRRADVNDDASVTISDAITILNYLFVGGVRPWCLDASDANDDGLVDITDATYVLDFLFRGGAYLPPPYPDAGLDPTPDDLGSCGL